MAGRPSFDRVVLAIILAVELVFAGVLVAKLIPDDEPSAPGPELVFEGGDVVSGVVNVTVEGAPGPFRFVVVAADGSDLIVGDGTSAAWDTRTLTNGPYTVEARQDGDVVASGEATVQNARADLGTTAAVVGASTAIAAGGSAIGSSLASQAAITAAQIGKESLIAVGEDHMRVRRAGKARRHMRSRIAFGLTLLLVLLFFTFEGVDSYAVGEYLRALPVVGGVAMVFVAGALGLEFLLGIASRVRTGFRFLGSGAVSLALSSVIFRTPFGIPGYVEEVGDEGVGGEEAGESADDEALHVEGIRALATMTAFLSLLVPFLWVGYQWNYEVVEVAMEIALVAMATSALPIKPLPGHEVWRWRKSVALLYVVGAFVLYFGYQLAFLPAGLLVPLGLVGALFYVGVLLWLRARSADAPPAWYRWMVDPARSWRFQVRSPAWVRRASAATERAVQKVADGIHGAFALAVQPFVGFVARRRRAKALAEVRRQNAELAAELADVLSTFEGLVDDQDFTLVGEDGAVTQRVGDFRDDAVRKVLKERLGDVAGPVTIIGPDGVARTVDLDDA